MPSSPSQHPSDVCSCCPMALFVLHFRILAHVLIGSTRGKKSQTLTDFVYDLNIDVPCNSSIAPFCKLAFSEDLFTLIALPSSMCQWRGFIVERSGSFLCPVERSVRIGSWCLFFFLIGTVYELNLYFIGVFFSFYIFKVV